MNRRLLSCVLAVAACSPELPALPTAEEDRQIAELQFLSIERALPEVGQDASLAWDRLPPGLAMRFRLQCLDRSGAVLAGSSVNVAARTADFRRRLSFPEGDTCRCDEAGHCDLYLLSEGEAGSAELVATAADSGVQARQAVTIVSAEEAPRIRLDVEGLAAVTWEPGQNDPLALAGTLTLSADSPQPAALTVRLEDAFGNPLTGRRVQIYSADVTPDQPVPDAGAAVEDAGATDVGYVDSGGVDAALDGGLPADTGSVDAGGEQLPSTAQAPTILLGSAADGCSNPQPPETPGAAVTDDQGGATFCLQPGVERGDWAVYLEPEGLIPAAFAHGETAFPSIPSDFSHIL